MTSAVIDTGSTTALPPIVDETESSQKGFVFPIDVKSVRVDVLGGKTNVELRTGNFVYIPRTSIDSFTKPNGELTYFGEYALFSTSTMPHGISLNQQSGFVHVRKVNGHFYTIVCSDKELDYARFMVHGALGKELPNYANAKSLLVSARRNFSIEALAVCNLTVSERDSVYIEDLSVAPELEIMKLAQALCAPHPEERNIMDFYRDSLFEPLAATEENRPFERTLCWMAKDIPSSMRSLDLLCDLQIARNK